MPGTPYARHSKFRTVVNLVYLRLLKVNGGMTHVSEDDIIRRDAVRCDEEEVRRFRLGVDDLVQVAYLPSRNEFERV